MHLPSEVVVTTFQFIEVSVSTISDSDIQRVAEQCRVTTERVRQYLASDEQDDILLRAFLFVGVGPVGKYYSDARAYASER